MAKKYKITNYGATRKFPYKGQHYEISRNSSIETDDEQLAKEFGEFQFVDAVAIEQLAKKASIKGRSSKKKALKRKKKVTAKTRKKVKRRKNKRRK